MVTPYEVYVTYLAIKRHFSSEKYDYFKYNGKIRCSMETFKKIKERFFFEKLSRKKKPEEIVDFFFSNFAASDNPSSLWIGDIVKNGETIYKESKRIKESLSYIFEQDLKELIDSNHLYELIQLEGSKHPKILKLFLNGSVRFETFYILITVLKLKSIYDQALEDPIWKQISNKIAKIEKFIIIDSSKYRGIIRKYLE
jgi:hypothetical protein